MDMTRDNRLLTYQEAAQYCGLTEGYFRNQHKERQGPEFVKPSPRRVFFTPRALDRWMANWKVVAR
jgi:predicted DNA-binding transcriptional regulator AlpA